MKEEKSYFERRSSLVILFFKNSKIDIELLGNENNPLMVTADNVALSCYVHNFELIFMDNHHNAVEIFRVKLNNSLKAENYNVQFSDWFKSSIHRKLFFIKSGTFYYHNTIKLLKENHPLWVKSRKLAFYVFSKKRAQVLVSDLSAFADELYIY